LSFPRDHAAHPDYRIEWWYYTGNLSTREGRRFGYQLTFFRVGVDPNPVNPSQWTVRDLHMAHLAITDIDRGLHRVAERLNRTGVGWAGASTDSLDVWNEDWRVTASDRTHRLQAMDTNQSGRLLLDLRLDSDMEPVLHGDQGFSQKGEDIGNASHYYSFTRLTTRGRLEVDGEAFDVTGISWMDHEFGSSFLEADQAGWDWFSIQLNDGTDLMVYTLRDLDGRADIRSSGTVVTSEGIIHLKSDDVTLSPRRRWISTVSGAAYPVDWRIDIPSLGLQLEVSAAIDAQELVTAQSTGVTYWEGAVDATGTHDGVSVSGEGYLEMTGYAGVPMSSVLR
jgi:predicted secreted hydrolase